MSYHNLYYHLVFRTFHSRPTLPKECNDSMIAYFKQVCANHKWHLEEANIHYDHVHILIALKPTDTPAMMVKEIKVSSSQAFKDNPKMPNYAGWAKGYGLFSISRWDVERISNYIKNQFTHHSNVNTYDEFKRILIDHGVDDGGFFDSNW